MNSYIYRQPLITDLEQQPQGRVLCFNPERILNGIQFHLTEERKACAVTPESFRDALDKLTARLHYATISADRWETMDNVQRLQWLLSVSKIAVQLSARGSAVLSTH